MLYLLVINLVINLLQKIITSVSKIITSGFVWDLGAQGARSGVIFSSPASVRAVLSRSGNVRESLFAIPTVAAGVTTAQELQAQGWQNVEIAQRSTPADIVVACEKLLAGGTMGLSG